MAALVGRRVRTTQPQQNPQIDWSNPITAGIVFAYVCGLEAMGYGEDGRNLIQYVNGSGTVVGVCVNTPTGTGVQAKTTSSPAFGPVQSSVKSGTYSLFAYGTGSASGIQSAIDDDDGTTRRFQFRLNAGKVELIPFYSGGNGDVVSPVALSSTDVATGFAMGASVSGTAAAIYQKGSKTSATLAGSVLTPNSSIAIAARKTGTTQAWLTGGLQVVAMWNRALTDAEHASLADNPWQLFKAALRRMWMPQPASNLGGLDSAGSTTSSAFGALATSIVVTSTGTSRQNGSGSLSTSISLVSAGTAISLAVAELIAQVQLDGAGTGGTTANTSLSTQVQLAGSANTMAVGSIALTTQIPLGSSGYSLTSASSALAIAAVWGSAGFSATSASADLAAEVWLGGSSYEPSYGAVSLATTVSLDGATTMSASGSGVVTAQIQLASDAVGPGIAASALSTSVSLSSDAATPLQAVSSLITATSTALVSAALTDASGRVRLTTSVELGSDASTPSYAVSALVSALSPNPDQIYVGLVRMRTYVGQTRVRTL